jgi:hypothetical protein
MAETRRWRGTVTSMTTAQYAESFTLVLGRCFRLVNE